MLVANIRQDNVYHKHSGIRERANNVPEGRSLDTLAQLETEAKKPPVDDDFTVGGGVDRQDQKALGKRARRKTFTQALALGLVDAGKQSGRKLEKSYWNSWWCASTLVMDKNERLCTHYCKTRWCMVCNAIRTAQHIIKYTPIISSWDDAHFVTLTETNCRAKDLRVRIDAMQKLFTDIKNTLRKRWLRSDRSAPKFKGIRKLECTYNSTRGDFNPHFHLIIESAADAEFVHNEWLRRNPLAGVQGQECKRAYGQNNGLSELFKYMTKVVSTIGGKREIEATALDIIFQAMHRKRVIQTFGFKVGSAETGTSVDRADVDTIFQWQSEAYDWVDVNTGELLTGYTPSKKFLEFLDKYKR